MLQVKYMTIEDIVRLTPNVRADLYGVCAMGVAYPVQSAKQEGSSVRVRIVVNFEGATREITLPLAVYEKLKVVPTHESVAGELRNVVP